jgi:hypothetical protein
MSKPHCGYKQMILQIKIVALMDRLRDPAREVNENAEAKRKKQYTARRLKEQV